MLSQQNLNKKAGFLLPQALTFERALPTPPRRVPGVERSEPIDLHEACRPLTAREHVPRTRTNATGERSDRCCYRILRSGLVQCWLVARIIGCQSQ
jgi:hypothetical protein